MSGSLKEVGIIIGEASSSEFLFSSKPSDMPSRWEYLMTYSEEEEDGQTNRVEVVAQIERVMSASQALTKDLDFDIIKKSGSWFSYGDTKLGQGRDAVKQLLADNPELAEEIEKKICEKLQAK